MAHRAAFAAKGSIPAVLERAETEVGKRINHILTWSKDNVKVGKAVPVDPNGDGVHDHTTCIFEINADLGTLGDIIGKMHKTLVHSNDGIRSRIHDTGFGTEFGTRHLFPTAHDPNGDGKVETVTKIVGLDPAKNEKGCARGGSEHSLASDGTIGKETDCADRFEWNDCHGNST